MKALIGHTGFVGSNLSNQTTFDKFYNSKNIESIAGEKFKLIVCAGVSSVKWKANKDPKRDFTQIQRLINNIEKTRFEKIILISTIAVYDTPADNAYGQNRLYLETYLKNKYENVFIVRLPSLFGTGLKKNAIYDLLHKKTEFLPHQESTFQYYCLDNLWNDVDIMQREKINSLNICSEPILFEEVLKIFDSDYICTDPDRIVHENMLSKHANCWGKAGMYLYNRAEIVGDLQRFIEKNG